MDIGILDSSGYMVITKDTNLGVLSGISGESHGFYVELQDIGGVGA